MAAWFRPKLYDGFSSTFRKEDIWPVIPVLENVRTPTGLQIQMFMGSQSLACFALVQKQHLPLGHDSYPCP